LHTYLGHHLGAHRAAGVPAKNLLCLPWRVAFALQEDGWILRNAIVRHKPNAMPESVRDRLNWRHELIFLFVKQAVLLVRPGPDPHPARHYPAGAYRAARPERPGPATQIRPARPPVTRPQRYGTGRTRRVHPNGRNPGDVWAIPTRPYTGPHFAAFPITLPLRCIAAGCKPGGTVLDPFTGSGTTGLAARQLGRRFTGIELSPAFAALAAERLREAIRPEDHGGPP
jgi:site-specific DNA-methyltransferase (cytosine-N4-specific)